MQKLYRVACDIGGTFTDFVVLDSATNALTLGKVLTTPTDAEEGIFEGLGELSRGIPSLATATSDLVHGTTLVINALVERKGSRTALVCTKGFRDILEMRDGMRYDVYDLQIEYPPPLVPRALRFEVEERLTANGAILKPLTAREAERVVREVLAAQADSVAICLLHSYVNPGHERQLGDAFRRLAPGVAVSLSCEVLPRMNEYHRTSTTVANAFVKPQVEEYLGKLAAGLAERSFGGRLFIMQSTTGVMERGTAQELPVSILESGPAGGVAAAIWWAKYYGLQDALCFDMGGTTAKLCPVIGGRAFVTDSYEAGRTYRFKRGSGYSVNVPVLDLLEVGTGGGSIAEVDGLGLLRVGPHSAGSVPGPVSYGRGGTRPTVTDADLVLGYLDERHFLGGSMALNAAACADAIETHVGTRRGMSLLQAADGIHQLANEDMASAARLHLAERGESPERLTLIAYGGAGPVHACGLATRLGCRKVLVPPAAGVMSALGMLGADIAMERLRTFRSLLATLRESELAAVIESLTDEVLARLAGEVGVEPVFDYAVETRYVGQGYAVEVPLDRAHLGAGEIGAGFQAVYRRLYGRLDAHAAIEIMSVRVRGRVLSRHAFEPRPLPPAVRGPEAALRTRRPVFFAGTGRKDDCPVYDRYRLRPGHEIEGPAVVEERETTTVVTPGARLSVHPLGLLVIDLEKS